MYNYKNTIQHSYNNSYNLCRENDIDMVKIVTSQYLHHLVKIQ